ncbi:hypothetical protein H7097_01880 [Aeromicrobium sp.]|nr:hypothetical protein [Candidatus Saccharibacteria bacterium]
MNFKRLEELHQTKTGLVLFGTVELALLYLFASLAINSGSLWQWGLTLILLIGVGQNFVRLMIGVVRAR